LGRTSDARERILVSAMELFYARSAADVGVQEICDHAGVKKGSFYHFFDSKQDLILAVLDAHWAWGKQMVWDEAFSPERPPLERLRELGRRFHEMTKADYDACGMCKGCGMGNIAAELGTQDEVVRKKVDEIFGQMINSIASTLDEAVANGDLPAMNTADAAAAIWAYFEGAMLMSKSTQNPDYIKRLFDTAFDFLDLLQRQAVGK